MQSTQQQELRFYGTVYLVDIERIRLKLIDRIQQAGGGLSVIALEMGFTRQTLWRFMHGEAVSLPTLLAVLKYIGLRFEDVAQAAVAA